MQNDVLCFLAEITFTHGHKIHIEHVVLRLYEVHYGLSYLYENPKLLENNRMFAVIKGNSDTWICDTWIYRKDVSEKCGIGGRWYGAMNLETDYDNYEELFSYMEDSVSYGDYGKVYYEYQ